jgi:CheY-like chemotaxis protein/HPt (histidine-containing phosphotransfer) domain-containing protein
MDEHVLGTNRPSDQEPRPIVVLLVDDQAFVAAAVGRLLATEHDIALHCCLDALDAIAMANRLNPAIILQDLVMPGIGGLALVALFRTNPPTAETPVIVLSGNDDPETRTRALAQGANDYLLKLPLKADLIACIRRHAAANSSSPAGTIPVALDRATATLRPTDETLDRSVLAAFQQGEAPGSSEFTRMLIDQFLRDAASQVEMLNDAARRSDTTTLEAIAHSLRGSSMTMGARKLGGLCAQMEGSAAGTPDGVAAEVLLAELDREFTRVRDALALERHRLDERDQL